MIGRFGEVVLFDRAVVGAEYVHFVRRGLARDPGRRWQSAGEIEQLHLIADGRFRVQCPMTLTKRTTRELGRAVDRRPFLSISLVVLGLLGVIGLVANAVHDALGAL